MAQQQILWAETEWQNKCKIRKILLLLLLDRWPIDVCSRKVIRIYFFPMTLSTEVLKRIFYFENCTIATSGCERKIDYQDIAWWWQANKIPNKIPIRSRSKFWWFPRYWEQILIFSPCWVPHCITYGSSIFLSLGGINLKEMKRCRLVSFHLKVTGWSWNRGSQKQLIMMMTGTIFYDALMIRTYYVLGVHKINKFILRVR